MAQNEASLLELCGICYTEQPKYRCPRCKAQTCSLPCYKRHQQRANCNGKRDPATYLKKSQLATAAGIDRDYNYLKSVEREIDQASRDALERGTSGSTARSKVFNRSAHPESALQRYLAANRIHVTRAPTGMQRQRTNRTRSTKRNHIMWTVEWIDDDESRDLQENSLASNTLRELHDLMCLEKTNAAKRRLALEPPDKQKAPSSTKRQRVEGAKGPEGSPNNPKHISNLAEPKADPEQSERSDEAGGQLPSPEPSARTDHTIPQKAVQQHQSCPSQDADHKQSQSELASTNDALALSRAKDAPSEKLCFYLLKPNMPSLAKVLIPLSPSASLTEALCDRTVLEYPTVYALSHKPNALPPGFISEDAFLAAAKATQSKDDETPPQAQTGQRPALAAAPGYPAQTIDVDPQRILDMLKRDLTG